MQGEEVKLRWKAGYWGGGREMIRVEWKRSGRNEGGSEMR